MLGIFYRKQLLNICIGGEELPQSDPREEVECVTCSVWDSTDGRRGSSQQEMGVFPLVCSGEGGLGAGGLPWEWVRGRLVGQQGRAEHFQWAHQGICSAVIHQVQVLGLECCSVGAAAHGSTHELPALSSSLGGLHPPTKSIPIPRIFKSLL